MEKNSPREKRYIRTKQAILEAAQQIIAEQGSEGLSMRELANRIEYSPSGLYEYFSSKDEILDAVCEESFQQLTAYLSRPSTNLPPATRLLEAAQAYLEFAVQHPEQYILMFVHKPSGKNMLAETRGNSAYAALKQIIQAGLTANAFKLHAGYGLEEITYSCWASVHGMAMLRLTLFKELGTEMDILNRQSVEGLIANLKASKDY